MPAAPHCVRCGREHFRFVRCTDVDAWNKSHARNEQRRANPRVENWHVPEGFREIKLGSIDPQRIHKRTTPEGYRDITPDLPRKRVFDGPEAA
jgi:hypothetical protein